MPFFLNVLISLALGFSSRVWATEIPQTVLRLRIQPTIREAVEGSGLVNYVPNGYPILCSGFLVRSEPQQVTLVTAGHCSPQALEEEFEGSGLKSDRYFFVVDDGVIEEETNPLPVRKPHEVEVDNQKIFEPRPEIDIALAHIPSDSIKYTQALPLARSLPRYKETVFATGYPGGFGPQQFQCRYVGVGIRTGDSIYELKLKWELECPELQKNSSTVEGISGGLVMNSKNQVIGVITEQLRGYKILDSGSGIRMDRLGFVPLIRKNWDKKFKNYVPHQTNGKFSSKYLDFTSGKAVLVKYQLKDNQLSGLTEILDPKTQKVIESWQLENGSWSY